MKKLASPTSPCRQRLHDVLVAREAERARKKAVPDRRKARRSQGVIMPNLFVVLAAAPPSDDTDATSPPMDIDGEAHAPK